MFWSKASIKGDIHMAVVVNPFRFNFIIASLKGAGISIALFSIILFLRSLSIRSFLLQPVCCRKHPHPGESKIALLISVHERNVHS